jgi:hypothetical protein
MAFPLGVSVSDFIAVVRVFKDAVDSLSNTRGARADYAELSWSLKSLGNALRALDEVKLDTNQHAQALKQNLDACKFCLTMFLEHIVKFGKLDPQYVSKVTPAIVFP